MHRPVSLAVLTISLLAFSFGLAAAQGRVTATQVTAAWADSLRSPLGRPRLVPHDLLQRVAYEYAVELAAAGVLSHESPAGGSRALDRVLRSGGTSILVSEILGAGPSTRDIWSAWERSPQHLAAVLDDRWTHLGAGCSVAGGQEVWVVMFCRSAVAELSMEERDGALLVTGRLDPPWAAEPWLDAGSGEVAPSSWDPSKRRFVYRLPLIDGRARFLLGCRDRYGDREATDSVTWPRGTASPAGAARFSEPAPPP